MEHIRTIKPDKNLNMTSHITPNEKENEQDCFEFSLLYNKTCKINTSSLSKILRINYDDLNFVPNWFLHNTGYVVCSIPNNQLSNHKRTLYMHRYLLNQYNYDGKISVDHINQDKTDNRLSNLRLATQSTQNHNQTKKERKFIKLEGFDIEIQLPEYIEFVNQETIKTIKNNKEYISILPSHFRIVSKYLNFEKHASKSNKISLKERLSNALIKRYNLIINTNINIKDLFIDGYHFDTNEEFEQHTIEYIKILCNISIDKIPDDDDFLENSQIKKNNIPKYVSYSPPKRGRGSQFTYDKRNKETNERTEFSSSGSKFKSLNDKFIEIISLMKKNNVDIIWDVKPDFVDQYNEVNIVINDEDYSKNCLMEIKKSRQDKTIRLKLNPLDIIIIQKLNNDIENISKSVVSCIMQINYDRVTQIINNELKLDKMDKITDDYVNYTNINFMEEYNEIKNTIITEMSLRQNKKFKPSEITNNQIKQEVITNKENKQEVITNEEVKEGKKGTNNKLQKLKKQLPDIQQLLDLSTKLSSSSISDSHINTNNKYNWKFDVNTIIKMILDKGVLSYKQISEKYRDIDGKPISISDVQNVCTNNKSYTLEESDFLNRIDISFEEYKTKRQSDVRLEMTHKIMKEKYSDILSDKYKQLCKTNSISKRTCDSTTMVDIFMDKYTVLTISKTASKYKNKNGDIVSDALVKQIWSGATVLFEDDFIGRTDITYEKYLIDCKKEKTEFSRPLEYIQKYEDIINGVNNGEIKSLNRTHIKTLEIVGKDDKFIIDLRRQIIQKNNK